MKEREVEPRPKTAGGPAGLVGALALILAGCGFNPMEGDYGPVEWVPEREYCREKVRYPDGRVNYEMRPCDGKDHDVKFLGRRW
jgi:hypothetical protein